MGPWTQLPAGHHIGGRSSREGWVGGVIIILGEEHGTVGECW